MKMGPKPKNQFKITCLECGLPMNNDHQTKQNLPFHAEMLKQHKFIRWEILNAPKISLKLARQKFRARKKHLVHLPVQLRFLIPSQQLMIVCRVILLIWNNPLCHLLKHVESRVQPPKSQQLLVRSRVNLETQNVSWTVEKTQDRSDHPGLITMNGRPGCTTTKRRMLRSVSHASKLSSKI